MNGHDADRRERFSGVIAADLDGDKQIWSGVGEAIAALARMLVEGCDTSAFCAAPPSASAVCARLVESIDDQVDVAAWRLIEAAAGAAVSR